MTWKNDLNQHPDPIRQDNEKLLNAFKELNSKNPDWEILQGVPYIGGFIGLKTEEQAEELIQNGTIPVYTYKGKVCSLIAEIVQAINENPELQKISWESYRDKKFTPEDPVIHWVKFKWNLESHILVKYLFKKETFYAFLKPELWRKNIRIGDTILRYINRNLKARRNEKN
jgi:hypothetical protein